MSDRGQQPAQERRRLVRRQRFAEHIEHEIRRLNALEEWHDYRFAELEAEIEAEGRYRVGRFPLGRRARRGLRRESSLSAAITGSAERLILVEGEPGSGKSVALRHVALKMAQEAMSSKRLDIEIPVYINLKDLGREQLANDRPTSLLPRSQPDPTYMAHLRVLLTDSFNDEELHTLAFDLGIDYESLSAGAKASKARELVAYCQRQGMLSELVHLCQRARPHLSWESGRPTSSELPIDRNLIHAFILKSLNRANDRDVEAFLEEEFDQGLRDGTWFFLFDSFDELPDVLSSTEADAIIGHYADAISDFLHGLNHCRGVVASRHFRGPQRNDWTRFRVLPLSDERRQELITRSGLTLEVENELVGNLGHAAHEIREMSKNPLFLGLLCQHMGDGRPFPDNTHTVFETYVESRFLRDEVRLQQRFNLTTSAIRATAENVAFAMAADPGLGLSPTRERLQAALERLEMSPRPRFETELDALEYIKLARSETTVMAAESKEFTFSHRRFQEYFVTCVVLRSPQLVSPSQLLGDARWRETAVTLCQTQPVGKLALLLDEARRRLAEIVDAIPDLIEDPATFVVASQDEDEAEIPEPRPFPWPAGVLYLLDLLQSGFGPRQDDLPQDLQRLAGQLLITAAHSGTLYDERWAVEVAGVLPPDLLLWLIRKVYATPSQWTAEAAYRQVSHLPQIPADIATAIRRTLLRLFSSGRERREYLSTQAYLSRLESPGRFLAAWRLVAWLRRVDAIAHLLLLVFLALALAQLFSSTGFWSSDEPASFIVRAVVLAILALVAVFLLLSYLSLNTLASFAVDWRGYGKATGSGVQQGAIGLLVRSFLLFFLPLVLLLAPWPAIIAFSLMFWAPFTLLAVITGQFVRRRWWPLMPLWPLFYMLRHSRRMVRTVSRFVSKWWQLLLLVGLFYALLAALTFPVFFGNGYSNPVVNATGYALLALIAAPSLVVSAIAVVRYWRDFFRWRQWRRQPRQRLELEAFMDQLSHYHHNSYRRRLLAAVRENQLLPASDESAVWLRGLALALERSLLERQRTIRSLRSPDRWRISRVTTLSRSSLREMWRTGRRNLAVGSGIRLKTNAFRQAVPANPGSYLTAEDAADRFLDLHTRDEESYLWVLGYEFLDELYALLAQLEMRSAD